MEPEHLAILITAMLGLFTGVSASLITFRKQGISERQDVIESLQEEVKRQSRRIAEAEVNREKTEVRISLLVRQNAELELTNLKLLARLDALARGE